MDKQDLELLRESFNDISKQVRKSSRSVKNRLHSILLDSQWVAQVQSAYNRPLIPNERCGLWYVPPELIKETAYFKSTDGHTSQWSFSTRRLNFHLFDIMVENQGIIIVDSTRRGKTMPDALSKTIPIWCAVLNFIMFGEQEENGNNWCFLPLQIISKNEANSIIKLIPKFAQTLIDLKIINKEQLLTKFKGKYLRPLWMYPGMSPPIEPPIFEDFIPIINCVASFRADDGSKTMNGFTYVQGAADDHELWAENLNPQLFWENVDVLRNMELSDEQLLNIIDSLKIKKIGTSSLEDVVELTDELSIGKVVDNIKLADVGKFDSIVVFSPNFTIEENESMKFHHYPFACDKKGSNELRKSIPSIIPSLSGRILVLCESGSDLSVGIALVLLSTRYNLDWEKVDTQPLTTKDTIKKHLAKVLNHKKVNPSRATLQAINSYLM